MLILMSHMDGLVHELGASSEKYNHVWCIEDSENGMLCFTTSKREH